MIPDEAYKNNLDLVEFVIPEGTRRIGRRAFAGCENLRFWRSQSVLCWTISLFLQA